MIATAVLVVAFAVAVVWIVRSEGAYYRQVGQLVGSLSGKIVKVGGTVVAKTLTHDDSGYHFTMRDLTGKTATVAVAYSGQVPDSFGPGVDVVVTGRYEAQTGAIAADELQTKCPSKYKASASPSP
jgi:cytochrome c-type biogenesis protein CcmE